MENSVVRIGKERFAAGLFWQPVPTAAVAAREARIVAARAELAADLFCVRRRGVAQFGLAQRGAGHRPGMRAIAAVVANFLKETTWGGVFAVDDRWLYLSVRKGTVMPDGDILFDAEAEAQRHLQEESASGGWDVVFAPAGWQVPGSRSDDIVRLLSPLADARLRPVVRNTAVPILAGAGCVVVAAACVWFAVIPARQEIVAVPNVPAAPPPPPPPWQGQPSVGALLRVCQAAIEKTRFLPGFDVEAVSCGSGGVTATYHRRSGSIDWLPKNSLISSPDKVAMVTALPVAVAKRQGPETPGTLPALRRHIWGAAQTYSLDTEVAEQAPPGSAALPGRAAANGDAPGFRVITVSVGGKLPPSALSGLLAGISTFVVDEVVWQPMSWRVKGKAYVF
ncbi:type 4b pilus protein PilO2 [Telmatospirillum sp.]|uniref:type 4b pilus protein PilO2 n=1 Tax=Telmatospirillum sp. TaxID=2079197 RepID=UPI00284D9FE7|nr:type 4b pilus protein PilO2 [Telmatospirillum sp.]MDR3438183.1 type 4b pilus protein PilO2 [Telmatospirillum sp.]